jgi:large subunit ribosomal protein L24
MPSLHIHRNDMVKVLTGADRGKTQRVLRVFPDKGTVLVEHVRVVKKTVSSKTSRQRTKVGYKMDGDTKVRICKKCGSTLPTKK